MFTVLGTLVAACFIWSLVLFFAAVFVRDREQEEGFSWALAGALVFYTLYCDRLPGHWTGPRELLTILPGVDHAGAHFHSYTPALFILLAIYALRMAVFYRLVGYQHDNKGRQEDALILNDFVAPVLSYACFLVCAAAVVSPLYSLGPVLTILLVAVGIAEHYMPILTRIFRRIADLAKLMIAAVGKAWIALRRNLVRLVKVIAESERWRRSDAATALSRWAEQVLQNTWQSLDESDAVESEMIEKTASNVRRHREQRHQQTRRERSRT